MDFLQILIKNNMFTNHSSSQVNLCNTRENLSALSISRNNLIRPLMLQTIIKDQTSRFLWLDLDSFFQKLNKISLNHPFTIIIVRRRRQPPPILHILPHTRKTTQFPKMFSHLKRKKDSNLTYQKRPRSLKVLHRVFLPKLVTIKFQETKIMTMIRRKSMTHREERQTTIHQQRKMSLLRPKPMTMFQVKQILQCKNPFPGSSEPPQTPIRKRCVKQSFRNWTSASSSQTH